MNIISLMNGVISYKIAEMERYTFYSNRVYSKKQWRILKWQTGYSCQKTGRKYAWSCPFIQLTPKYKMEYPITLKKVKEYSEIHNLKFWM